MSYLTREMSVGALHQMKKFHQDVVEVYKLYGMDLLDNLGRRNIIMSQTQERFFSDALSKKYDGVYNDGQTGQPDIIVEELGKELECKLTSRHKGGAISFQTDYQTLKQKGSLDYLYVIADQAFDKFAVLHFQNLTVNDFRPVSNGSRGKVAMYKHKGMKKCNVLVGDVVSNNKENLQKISRQLKDTGITSARRKKLLSSLDYWKNTPERYSYVLEDIN